MNKYIDQTVTPELLKTLIKDIRKTLIDENKNTVYVTFVNNYNSQEKFYFKSYRNALKVFYKKYSFKNDFRVSNIRQVKEVCSEKTLSIQNIKIS